MASGWSPVLGLADDGTYYYIQVKDWVGGTGTKPLVGQYLSTAGWTNNIASASRIAIVGGGIPDGDKGDIVVSSGGSVWTIEARAVTAAKLFEVGANKFLGNHSGSAGDVQEIGLGGGLEFHGGSVRRAALTGDVTAAAGSNATTITPAADPSWITSLALNKLTQSGATTGQIVQWNGTAWVPVTFSGGVGGTTGATDNALLRADGTGGATVQSSTVTISDAGVIVTPFGELTTHSFGGRDFTRLGAIGSLRSIVLGTAGTGLGAWGFICVQVPDGTTTGGNLRGHGAVDFQTFRTAASHVAGGDNSLALGNRNSIGVSGSSSIVWGQNNTVQFSKSAAGGEAVTMAGADSIGVGFELSCNANYTATFGRSHTNAAQYGLMHGFGALNQWESGFVGSAGSFATRGDSQHGILMARRATTDATTSTIFIDGSSSRLLLPANSRGRARITAVAATATATGSMMTWVREICWWRGVAANTTTIDVQTIGTDRGLVAGTWGAGPAWTFAVNADTTNGAIDCAGTGAAGTNIRWTLKVEFTMEVFA